ncbi:MAG: M23 family metallopeptidase, partial [Actinomycetota bacterium]|nr:M23 family metallopeptidase [Actinomycetota bacterium]
MALVLAAAASGEPAAANPALIEDRNDVPSPLDIASARHGHAGANSVTATVTMYGSFSSRQLRGENGVALAVSTSRSPFPNRWIFVSYERGRLRAVVRQNDGVYVSTASASRPQARTVRVWIPKRALDGSPGYYWTAFTTFRDRGACDRFCVDATKTRLRHPQTGALVVGRVLHDYTAPTIGGPRAPNPSSNASPTLRYRVSFGVRDRGFSGLRRWRLEERLLGASWRGVATGERPGAREIPRTGAEGATYQHRVVARDRQGNWRRSRTAFVTVPFDDDNRVLVPGFSGAWESSSVSGSFGGTLHTTADPTATFSYSFRGTHTAWIASGTGGTASVQVDANAPQSVKLPGGGAPRRVVFARTVPPGAHTVTVRPVSGTVNVDGVAIRGSVPQGTGAAWTNNHDGEVLAEQSPRIPAATTVEDGIDCTFSPFRSALTEAICAPQGRLIRPPEPSLPQHPARRSTYNDAWYGWPVRPLFRQHPIRGSFLDLRPMGNHFGIDIGVRDDRPESGAPRGRTHRVYAVEGGVVGNLRDGSAYGCGDRRIEVGHFSYYHVDAIVAAGQRVAPGQVIGWTCKGWWHVHLSEFTWASGGRVLVNPLRRGGKLRPYADTARPLIHAVRFYRPAAQIWSIFPGLGTSSPITGRKLEPTSLRGTVDVRAWISDPQSFRGWFDAFPALYEDHHPYGVRLRIVR